MPSSDKIEWPFDEYTWLWAMFMPQEYFKNPSKYISIIRVLMRYEGLPYSQEPHKEALLEDLEALNISSKDGKPMKVRRRNGTNVILRNDKPYWTTTGVLMPTDLTAGKLVINPVGKALALGRISNSDFAKYMCERMQLPNLALMDTEAKYQPWAEHNVKLRPLALITKLLTLLHESGGVGEAYITPEELGAILMPMAPSHPVEGIAEVIAKVRSGQEDGSRFPSRCLVASDGKELRVAREFLQFLAIGGFVFSTKRNVTNIARDGDSAWCMVRSGDAQCYMLNTFTNDTRFGELSDSTEALAEFVSLADSALQLEFLERENGETYEDFRRRYCTHLGSYDFPIEGGFSHLEDRTVAELAEELRQKKQMILKGPPGTGKTRMAIEIMKYILEAGWRERGCIVQFHQSYSYEDFIEGIRPVVSGEAEGSGPLYDYRNGIFKRLCLDAQDNPEEEYILIIDEINRGNISEVFGELYMLIEDTYRSPDYAVILPYTGESFYIPKNVYIIGTMNTVDKTSIDVDIALERRFSTERLEPDAELLDNELEAVGAKELEREDGGEPILPSGILLGLNKMIEQDIGLGNDYKIGHSFFLPRNGEFTLILLYKIFTREVIPILEEYLRISTQRFSGALQDIGLEVQGTSIVRPSPAEFLEIAVALSSLSG